MILLHPLINLGKKKKRKEIERNRMERFFNRDAISKASNNIEKLRQDLGNLLKTEQDGKKLSKTKRLKKKVLKENFSAEIRRSLLVKNEIEMIYYGKCKIESTLVHDPIRSAIAYSAEEIKCSLYFMN